MKIICPHCNFSKAVDPGKVPDRPVKVTCPKCAQGFDFNKADLLAAEAFGQELPPTPPAAAAPPVDNGDHLAQIRHEAPLLTTQTRPKAGFWIRVVATTLDSLIVLFVLGLLVILMGILAQINFDIEDPAFHAFLSIANIFCIVLAATYQVFFTGYCGQTPGKMALRIKVIRCDGTEISYGRAFLREIVGKYISQLLFCIGYLMVAFDAQKQGLHDKIANTYVIKL